MRDLASPLLSGIVVSGLVGLSPATLRRWDALGVIGRPRRGTPRLYSWRDVDRLQRAAYLVRAGRLPLAEVRQLLGRAAPTGQTPAWLLSRSKRRVRPKRRGGVIAVTLPRSARRRGHRRGR